jgi:hypothetical protein
MRNFYLEIHLEISQKHFLTFFFPHMDDLVDDKEIEFDPQILISCIASRLFSPPTHINISQSHLSP